MITPRNKYNIPTVYVEGLKEDSTLKNFIHCYIPEPVPIGKRKLWGIEYPIKPINVKHVDSSELLLELATIDPDEVIGERIVSRILFKSSFVLNIYGKMLSIERPTRTGAITPILMIKAHNNDLEHAFNELFFLIQGYDGMTENREGKVTLDSQVFRPRHHNNSSRPSTHLHRV